MTGSSILCRKTLHWKIDRAREYSALKISAEN
jgi:hypothetical protein